MVTRHSRWLFPVGVFVAISIVPKDMHAQESGTCYITNIDFFAEQCPTLDPAIDEIRSDFRITVDGVDIEEVNCEEPISSQPLEAFTDELRLLQVLRTAYYIDKDRSGHLPWTELGLYDWLKSKVGGFNISSTARYNSCCGTWANGDRYITLITQSPEDVKFLIGWPLLGGVALLMHEARHLDGFGHTSCCEVGAGACDLRYDESNLSPYAIQHWLYRSYFQGFLYTGYTCLDSDRAEYIGGHLVRGANNYIPRFCESPPPVVDDVITAPCLDCQPPPPIITLDDGPFAVDEGGALLSDFNVLENDVGPENVVLTVTVVDPPAHAAFFEMSSDGFFDYTHDGSETTEDQFTYRASDGSSESETASVAIEIKPVNDAPKIYLIGQHVITLDGSAAFDDPGATANDAEDGDISGAIVIGGDTVDETIEATYVITYNVTDSEGLAAAEVIRSVVVEIDDPPVITLVGPAAITLEAGAPYDEQGATAHDEEDGDLTDEITISGSVDTGVPGTYSVTYTVVDSSGNQDQVQRTVTVEAVAPQPPKKKGSSGGAVSLFEVLALGLLSLMIGGRQRMAASGRKLPVRPRKEQLGRE